MLVFIAPYNPVQGNEGRGLGATRKIEFFLSLAARLSDEVVLINTAHATKGWSKRQQRRIRVGDASIHEITLRTYPRRPIGKLLNLLEIGAVSEELASLGNPTAVWIYNAYVFESMLARELTRRFGAKLIFEFEDWLLSRRLWHPKPLMDFFAWRYFLPEPALCLAVNSNLSSLERRRSGCPVVMCPGIVSAGLLSACQTRPAFSKRADASVVVGYFGGLSIEKGADVLLDLIRSSSDEFVFSVCGVGPLSQEFRKLAEECDRLHFHGRVDDPTLFRLISECDVLVNIHSSIEKMANGIFPFKVIEYVAAGRLVISTPIPEMGIAEIADAICVTTPDVQSVAAWLAVAKETFNRKRAVIDRAMVAAGTVLSAGAMEKAISSVLRGSVLRGADVVNDPVTSGVGMEEL
ncbi:glycosyltransferase [Paraburkholderia sediminicola]|uniref:glycosyltransferase n=1 Tax=Paraburkholderia sediminicola TaxID=458836 RepID=UPI0038BDD70C